MTATYHWTSYISRISEKLQKTNEGHKGQIKGQTKGIYNRSALIKCYLLDMDLALYDFCLPSLVKFIKSWIYFIIMKLDFTQIK